MNLLAIILGQYIGMKLAYWIMGPSSSVRNPPLPFVRNLPSKKFLRSTVERCGLPEGVFLTDDEYTELSAKIATTPFQQHWDDTESLVQEFIAEKTQQQSKEQQ